MMTGENYSAKSSWCKTYAVERLELIVGIWDFVTVLGKRESWTKQRDDGEGLGSLLVTCVSGWVKSQTLTAVIRVPTVKLTRKGAVQSRLSWSLGCVSHRLVYIKTFTKNKGTECQTCPLKKCRHRFHLSDCQLMTVFGLTHQRMLYEW